MSTQPNQPVEQLLFPHNPRMDLMVTLFQQRTYLGGEALKHYCELGHDILDKLEPRSEDERCALALGHVSLDWLADQTAAGAQLTHLLGCAWQVIRLDSAVFDLKAGRVDRTVKVIADLMAQRFESIPATVLGLVISTAELLYSERTVSHLKPLLSHSTAAVRWYAARALGQLGDATAVALLIAALGDEDSEVRGSAARALGQLGDATAVPALIAALSDEASTVRGSAADALGRLKATVAIPRLVATSGATHQCITALAHLDPAEAVLMLNRLYHQPRRNGWGQRMRGHAHWRLGNLDSARASFERAIEIDANSTNRLALAHFYLEQGAFDQANESVQSALLEAERDDTAICLLSEAVVQWLMGNAANGLRKLNEAQALNRRIASIKDLQYDYFWRVGPVND